MIKQIHIFDIDGVLVDSSHRYRTINGKIDLPYWRKNCIPEKIFQDKPLPMAKFYKDCLANPSVYTIIATARQMINADFEYIKNILGWPDKLIYRKDTDTRRGAALKGAGLRQLFALKQFKQCPNRHFWEDNVDYLKPICDEFNVIGHYIPSNQGY